MAKKWEGKTKGGLLGYKIFVFLIQYIGLWAAYTLLFFVAFYFLLFSRQSTKASYDFFRTRLGWGSFKSIIGVYRTYLKMGQALIDRTAVLSGLDKFTFFFDGEHHLKQMAADGKGGILISGHVGNWAIAGPILDQALPNDFKVHVVMLAEEHKKIQEFLDNIQVKQTADIIPIGNDFSHIIAMGTALRKGELICMHGDRYLPNQDTVAVDFFGAKAHFPAGPFQLAVRMKVPYTITYAFKETWSHYHFYSTPPLQNPESVEVAAQYFADSLEQKMRQYPYQWFNFYDFWETPEQVSKQKSKKQLANG